MSQAQAKPFSLVTQARPNSLGYALRIGRIAQAKWSNSFYNLGYLIRSLKQPRQLRLQMWGLEFLIFTLRNQILNHCTSTHKVIFLNNIFVMNMLLDQHIIINFPEYFFNMHIVQNELEFFYTIYINRQVIGKVA